jgi:hypothetical protein
MSDDDILQARVSGQSVQSIARLFKTSVRA